MTKQILEKFGVKRQDNKNTPVLTMLIDLERRIEHADGLIKEQS
jgi:hypothetical protein